MSVLKAVELFAGGGGLAIAIARAGFKTSAVVEWDNWSCQTLDKNRSILKMDESKHITPTDIRNVSFRELEGKIDLVSGGPPCQPFSLGGKHMAYDDARDMFPQAIRALREIKPKAFFFENVKGLTRAAFSHYLEYIKFQLSYPSLLKGQNEDWQSHSKRLQQHHTASKENDLEYKLLTRVVNAADYGVPQRRERLMIIGVRSDLGVEWSFPAPTHSLDALVWDLGFSKEYWDRHRIVPNLELLQAPTIKSVVKNLHKSSTPLFDYQPWKTTRDVLFDIKNITDPNVFPNHIIKSGAKSYPGHTGSILDFPAKTLKAGVHGVPGGENMLVKEDGSVRYFTAREAARLQTFPDNYIFSGSWSESMRQIGNAVPVTLAEVISKELAKVLITV